MNEVNTKTFLSLTEPWSKDMDSLTASLKIPYRDPVTRATRFSPLRLAFPKPGFLSRDSREFRSECDSISNEEQSVKDPQKGPGIEIVWPPCALKLSTAGHIASEIQWATQNRLRRFFPLHSTIPFHGYSRGAWGRFVCCVLRLRRVFPSIFSSRLFFLVLFYS